MRTVSDQAEILRRLDEGERRFRAIEQTLIEIAKAVEPLPEIKKSIDATKEIVELWDAAKTGGKVLKWFAGVFTALGLIYAASKGVFLGIFSE